MAYRDNQLLFYEYDLGETLRAHISRAAKAVDEISERDFLAASDDDLTTQVASQFEIQPIELLEDQRTMAREETRIDVSQHPDRNPFGDAGPIYVAGIRVVVSTPFRGDSALWKMRPNAWQSTFPRGNVRARSEREGVLEIDYTKPADERNDRLKQIIDSTFKDIRFYLGNQKSQIDQELTKIRQSIADAIRRRRDRLGAHDNLSAVLGIPMATDPTEIPVKPPRPAAPRGSPIASETRQKEKRQVSAAAQWDVFVSHASEDKDSVARPLALALQKIGFRVWFDEMTLKVGDSLRRSIDQGLAKSRFGIVVISPAFLKKEWPQRELDGLVAREVLGRKVILPVWHDVDATVVTAYSPTLADRVAARTNAGLDQVVEAIRKTIE